MAYTPDSRDSDLSVTIWQLMALRSAKNAGLQVPGKAISDAVGYLKRSYKSKLDEQGNPMDKVSGFAYQPGGHPEYTTTAAGLLAMQVCGEYESPFVLGGADWLLKHKPQANRKYFFYGTYYYAQAMYQREMNTPRWVGNGSKKFFCPCKRKAVRGKVVMRSPVMGKSMQPPWPCSHSR